MAEHASWRQQPGTPTEIVDVYNAFDDIHTADQELAETVDSMRAELDEQRVANPELESYGEQYRILREMEAEEAVQLAGWFGYAARSLAGRANRADMRAATDAYVMHKSDDPNALRRARFYNAAIDYAGRDTGVDDDINSYRLAYAGSSANTEIAPPTSGYLSPMYRIVKFTEDPNDPSRRWIDITNPRVAERIGPSYGASPEQVVATYKVNDSRQQEDGTMVANVSAGPGVEREFTVEPDSDTFRFVPTNEDEPPKELQLYIPYNRLGIDNLMLDTAALDRYRGSDFGRTLLGATGADIPNIVHSFRHDGARPQDLPVGKTA